MGKKQPVIICIGFPSWDTNYTKSTMELMKVISSQIPVVYVNYPFTMIDVVRGILGKKKLPLTEILKNPHQKTFQYDKGEVTVLYPPPFLPNQFLSKGKWFDYFSRINARMLTRRLENHLTKCELQPLAVINAFNPFVGAYYPEDFQKKYPQYYYCYDEIKLTQWSGKHGGYLEEQFLMQTAAHFFSSKPLLQTKSKKEIPAFLVQNGVDYDLFHQAFCRVSDRSSTPSAFYIGAIDDRLDYPLLADLIGQLKHWKFHFFGPIKSEHFQLLLAQNKNLHYEGNMDAQEIPAKIRDFHIGLIPFVHNDFTKNIYPLKINEYLAAGKQVVSTDFGDLKDFEQTIYISQNREQFASACQKAMEELTEERIAKNAAFAANNSWQHRGAVFLESIMQLAKQHEQIPY
ncbi:glycosyltransferase [Persicobacter diffluens]|uniref:Glycosyltransferase n=1 Tax=Persicobacter diffluens TaxID=981 RepID=A0AAN4VZN6_9BACT|nr:hypothetical protein PEDI_18470 [Persicobacter diffluens]